MPSHRTIQRTTVRSVPSDGDLAVYRIDAMADETGMLHSADVSADEPQPDREATLPSGGTY